jgi:hypothetical protein
MNLNINYALANAIHSEVVNEALIDSHLLLDDYSYTRLLTDLINKDHKNVDTRAIKELMLDYVNNNY